ncbi:MAG: hypothetical protein WCX17_04460 [Parcubacteria group bacterium]
MVKFKKKISFVTALCLLTIPLISSAAGLIPCATTENPKPCTLCHFIVGFKNLVDYGLGLITIAAIAGLFFAGVMYIISSGDESMMTSAKGFIKSSLIGFAVVFLGWLIITVTMYVLGAKTADNGGEGGVLGIQIESWNKFSCDTTSSAPPPPPTP